MAFLDSQDNVNLPDSMELNYQRYLVKVCMLIGIPVLGYFMIYDFIIGRYFVAIVLILMFVIILGLFLIINKPDYQAKESRLYTYFLNTLFILFGFFLAYTIGIEGNLSRMPWAFLFTVLVFFLFSLHHRHRGQFEPDAVGISLYGAGVLCPGSVTGSDLGIGFIF
jgi:hypothetical protein